MRYGGLRFLPGNTEPRPGEDKRHLGNRGNYPPPPPFYSQPDSGVVHRYRCASGFNIRVLASCRPAPGGGVDCGGVGGVLGCSGGGGVTGGAP